MALKLRAGTEVLFVIKQDDRGFVLLQRIRVTTEGRDGKRKTISERPREGAKAKRFTREEDLAEEIETLGQRWLANLGLERAR